MPKYEVELGPYVVNLICECCNEPMKRVWGFVSKDERAFGVYYALLVEHGDERWVGLTISIGDWWKEEDKEKRRWCHIQAWNDGESFVLTVKEPTESNYFPWDQGGTPFTRDELLANEIREEFYAVADYLNVEDPAVNSFLLGKEVSIKGRGCKHLDGSIDWGGQTGLPAQIELEEERRAQNPLRRALKAVKKKIRKG